MTDLPTWLNGVPPERSKVCLFLSLGEPHLRTLILLCSHSWRSDQDASLNAHGITLDADRLRTLRAMINRELAAMGGDR